jgi:hypothetical protein
VVVTINREGGTMNAPEQTTEARPKRLSLSEILELVLTKGHDGRSTVSLTRTASGEVVIDVKVSAESVAEASAAAEAELERLSALYPRNEQSAAPVVSLSRNAKGDTQVDVKGNGWDETQTVYERARLAYPMGNGQSARAGSVA